MRNLLSFASKKPLAPVLLVIFIIGIIGGTVGSYAYFKYRDKIPVIGNQLTVTENSAIINAVKKTDPSVVSITGVASSNDFFGNSRNAQIAGTGFIVDKSGLVLTNKHVVANTGASYTVYTANGKKYTAKVKSVHKTSDLALLKINGNNLPAVSLGNSDTLQLGQSVIAIGNALGQYDNTVTTGIVSGLGRQIQAGDIRTTETLKNVIQTDAVINQGNSGGPLLNLDGQVIGINTATDSQGEAISFAIPINVAKSFIAGNSSIFSF